MTDKPLTILGDLSKPATVLIEKISNAVGGVFKPYQIIRIAKAEVEAEQIRAESQIEITDLHRRAMRRFLEEEAKKQSIIESITQQALPLLEDKSSPDKIQDDWIANFFDKCRIISDGEMQRLWSRVLAGEANSPGAFSKRTVNLLGDLENRDAELFTRLCGFNWRIGSPVPLIFDEDEEIYKRHGITFNALIHLESLGLIQFNALAGFRRVGFPKVITVFYYGQLVRLTFPKDTENDLEEGHVLLSRAGEELAHICGSQPVDGFFNFVYDRWAEKSFVPKRETGQGVPAVT